MEKFLKKIDELETLLKVFMPSIKTPKPTSSMPKVSKVPGPKMSGVGAPASKKDPTKVAEQLKNAGDKQSIKIGSGGQWDMGKTEEPMYHLYQTNKGIAPLRITDKPMKLNDIHKRHGKDIESKGFLIKPHNPINK